MASDNIDMTDFYDDDYDIDDDDEDEDDDEDNEGEDSEDSGTGKAQTACPHKPCETVKETESKAQLWGPSQFGLLVTDQKFIFCSKLKGVRLLPSMVQCSVFPDSQIAM